MAKRIIAEGLSVRSVEELITLDNVDGETRERKERKERKRTMRSDELEDLVSELSSRVAEPLDTRVNVSGLGRSNARGALVIKFSGAEDLR